MLLLLRQEIVRVGVCLRGLCPTVALDYVLAVRGRAERPLHLDTSSGIQEEFTGSNGSEPAGRGEVFLTALSLEQISAKYRLLTAPGW